MQHLFEFNAEKHDGEVIARYFVTKSARKSKAVEGFYKELEKKEGLKKTDIKELRFIQHR